MSRGVHEHCGALQHSVYSKAVMDLCRALVPLATHLQPCQSLADGLGLSPGMCLCRSLCCVGLCSRLLLLDSRYWLPGAVLVLTHG